MIGEQRFQPRQKSQERKEGAMHSIQVLHEADEKFISDLLKIRQEAFPDEWNEYEDAIEFYRESIANPDNIALVLKKEDEIMGFLLAMPHNVVREELIEDDPLMPEDDKCYYVETTEISPELGKTLAGGKMFFRMLRTMFEEAEKHGVNRFTMHARVNTGLSSAVQKYFGPMIKTVRRIDQWKWNANEPSDYLLGVYEK